MTPSTPMRASASISSTSLTVHTTTFRPSARASASASAVRSRWYGDHPPASGGFHQPRHRAAGVVDVQPGGPRRGAGPVAPDVVEPPLLGGQAYRREFRGQPADLEQDAPVEGLDVGPVEHPFCAQYRHHRAGECARLRRLFRGQGRQLGLEVEARSAGRTSVECSPGRCSAYPARRTRRSRTRRPHRPMPPPPPPAGFWGGRSRLLHQVCGWNEPDCCINSYVLVRETPLYKWYFAH